MTVPMDSVPDGQPIESQEQTHHHQPSPKLVGVDWAQLIVALAVIGLVFAIGLVALFIYFVSQLPTSH